MSWKSTNSGELAKHQVAAVFKSITQAEFAELLGVSNRSISRWENGTTMLDFDLR